MPFLVALGLGIVLTPLARRAGLALRLVDRPGELKVHLQPVPFLGGVAVVFATLGSLGLAGSGVPLAVAVAAIITMAVGLVDDAGALPTVGRLALQAAGGWVLVLVIGLDVVSPAAAAGIVALVVVSTNAVNMVDGQDGLAGSTAAIAALAMAAFVPSSARDLALALAGALAAFLVWNRPPAKIFLGDGGAYAVGTLLAILAVEAVATDGARGLLASGIALAVFAIELVFTVTRRLVARRPLTRGDRFHTYDLVADALGSRARSTLAFAAAGAVAGGLAILASTLPVAVSAVVAAVGLVGAVALGAGPWGRRRVEGGARA